MGMRPTLLWIMAVCGGCSLFQGLFTLFPWEDDGQTSDGAKRRLLLRGGEGADRYCSRATFYGLATGDIQARSWPPELVKRAVSPAEAEVDDPAYEYWACEHAYARWRLAEAAGYLDRALEAVEGSDVGGKSLYLLRAAFFTARHCGDAKAARAFLDQAGAGEGEAEPLSTRWQAETAVCLAEADPDRARHEARVRFKWASRLEARQDSPDERRT